MTAFGTLLITDFEVYRIDRASDGQGGWVVSYADIGSVSGRIRPASSTERQTAMLNNREISHVLYVGADADIVRGDRVEAEDLVVEVLGVRNPSNAGHHLEIDCVEIQHETGVEDGS